MRCTAAYVLACALAIAGCLSPVPAALPSSSAAHADGIALPTPVTRGGPGLADLLAARRSRRSFGPGALDLDAIGQLLWSAAGSTDVLTGATRTAPSAGATHPLEIYVVLAAGEVPPGVYRYDRSAHALLPVRAGDVRVELASAALHQQWVALAPATLVVTADFARTTSVYGERGVRYVYLEAGHVAQNICLAVEALGLGAVVVGAFRDAEVRRLLAIDHEVILLLPVGRRPDSSQGGREGTARGGTHRACPGPAVY